MRTLKEDFIHAARTVVKEAIERADDSGDLWHGIVDIVGYDRDPTDREIEWFRGEIHRILERVNPPAKIEE